MDIDPILTKVVGIEGGDHAKPQWSIHDVVAEA